MDEARRQLISERTREAIAERKRAGIYRGPPRLVSDDVVEIIVGLRRRGWSLRRIAWLLDAEGRRPPRAERWDPSTIRKLLARETSQ